MHQGEPGLRSAAERLSYALNDNFRAFVADELQADESADLTEACQAYLEHRQARASWTGARAPRATMLAAPLCHRPLTRPTQHALAHPSIHPPIHPSGATRCRG